MTAETIVSDTSSQARLDNDIPYNERNSPLENGKRTQFDETSGVSDEDHQTSGVSDEDHQTSGVSDEDHQTSGVSDEDHQTSGVSDEDGDEVDISCGIWKLRTKVFGKWFANLYLFAVFAGLATLFNHMVMEIVQVQLTSLERQFNIDNTRAGLFDTAYKSGYMCTILFVGHFAKTAHIPVIVGLSGVIQGSVLVIPPILQFVDPYTLPVITDNTNSTDAGENAKYLCLADGEKDISPATNATAKDVNRLAYNVLIVVHALKGITDVFHAGFLPALYMDDNSLDKSRMGILLGIQSVFHMLASPLGREINGIISDIPIDLKETHLKPKDHRFVAAWWLGFLIFGIGTAVFSVPVMLFPRRLVSKREQKKATDKAVVTFAGGHVEEEVEVAGQEESVKENVERTNVVNGDPDPARSKRRRSSYRLSLPQVQPDAVRKSSMSNISNGSRRSSLFPPITGPTERRVSITGDIVFQQQVQTVADGDSLKTEETVLELIKDFPRALYRVLRKPIFLLLILDICLESLPVAGSAFFRSTYMANEYNIPMSRVAFLSGIASAVGNTAGVVITSLLVSRVTTTAGYIIIMFSTYFIATCVTPLNLIFGCDNQPVYGASGEIGIPVNISGTCSCDAMEQLLSCGDDGNNYLSPCHAGCSGVHENTFTNCTLLANHTGGNTLSTGLCSTDCERNFLIYIFILSLQNFVSASSILIYKLLVLRSVDPQDRAFGISIYFFFYILLAVPAPNVFGHVVDSTCYIKDGDYCALYDRNAIRYFISGIDVAIQGTAQIMSLAMLCYLRWAQGKRRRETSREAVKNKSEVPNKTDGV